MRFAPVRVVSLVSALATAAGVLAAPAVAAAPTWSVVPSPNAPRPNGSLTAVECPTADTCLAVGPWTDTLGRPAIQAQRSTDGVWQRVLVQQAPHSPALTGMTCVSATWCLAVGHTGGTGAPQSTFAEVWDGTGWHADTTPDIAGNAVTRFERVSCVSTAFCMAVGSTSPTGNAPATATPVAAVRRDGVWSLLPSFPAGTGTGPLRGELHGVDCTGPTACVAVGFVRDSRNRPNLLGESWDGTTFTPFGYGRGGLNAVECSGTTCTAVGYAGPPGSPRPLAIGIAGLQLTSGHVFDRRDRFPTQLTGLSCLSATLCDAVGSGFFAKTVDGGQWRAPEPPADAALSDIACRSGDHCVVVGAGAEGTFGPATGASYAALWDGHTFTRQTTTDRLGVARGGWLAVSCKTTTSCLALDVGDTTGVFRWDGTTWSRLPDPVDPGGGQVHLDDISCPADGDCVAIGDVVDPAGDVAFVSGHWSAATWRFTPLAVPAGLTPVAPLAVSCAALARCEMSLRTSDSANDNVTVLEGWDGRSWTAQASVGGNTLLYDISCAAATRCAAAGIGGPAPAIQTWDGTSWTAATVPFTGSSGYLSAVSCAPGGDACTAVGTEYGATAQVPLAVTGSGTTWTEQAVPVGPAGTTDGALVAVACTTTSACTATGVAHAVNDPYLPVTERWDGTTWTVQDTPAAHLAGAQLLGVACPAIRFCLAVGSRPAPNPVATGAASLAQVWRGQSLPAVAAAATRSRSALRGRQAGKP